MLVAVVMETVAIVIETVVGRVRTGKVVAGIGIGSVVDMDTGIVVVATNP